MTRSVRAVRPGLPALFLAAALASGCGDNTEPAAFDDGEATTAARTTTALPPRCPTSATRSARAPPA